MKGMGKKIPWTYRSLKTFEISIAKVKKHSKKFEGLRFVWDLAYLL